MSKRMCTTRLVTSAKVADYAQTRPQEMGQTIEVTIMNAQSENVGNSDFQSTDYKVADAARKALTNGVKASKNVTAFLKEATPEQMKVLGALLSGAKFDAERKLLNDLVRKNRKAGNLPCEDNLDGTIYTFKESGLVETKKPVRKETQASEPQASEPQASEPQTVVVPDFMTEFAEFLAVMTDDELNQARGMVQAEIERRIARAGAQQDQANAA